MTAAPRSRFAGGLLAALVVLGVAVLVGLGFWQLSRLQQRRAANAAIAARLAQPPVLIQGDSPASLPEYQPVRVRGEYDFSQEIVLRNRTHLDAPGVHVLTPLRIEGSDYAVLVDRGWIPYTEAAPESRAAYHSPTGVVEVAGLVRASQVRAFALLPADPTLSPDTPRVDAWFWVNVDQIQDQVPYPLLAYFIEQTPDPDPAALPAAGATVDLSDGPHLAYALQWFAFALILGVGSIVLWRGRGRPRALVPRPPHARAEK